jgi:uncharacterized membrane protein
MNDQDRFDLEDLRARHDLLGQELAALGERLAKFEARAEAQTPAETPSVPPPSTLDTLLARVPALDKRPTAPPVIAPTATPAPQAILSGAEFQPSLSTPAPEPTEQGSFEMRLGTYWLVRIGVVMVLTALVFFGNLAYQHFISQLGAGGKVTLLYLASFLLLGAGAWWQRRAVKENLRNYAQVLFAGGLAAVYFTTYAAHHFPLLQVIGSPLLDGALLLAWTAFMVYIADRRKSEVMALFGVGLAFYASVITRVGYFTLYSNLLLCAAALFFLVRNRWATLSFGTLVASYVAYAFWRFMGPDGWRWASSADGLWLGACFLFAYWLIFTASVFLSRDNEQFAFEQRSLFLTLNNAALLGLFVLTMLQVREGGLWRFLLVYGSVLLALAVMARQFLPNDPLARSMYVTQGLLLVTLGLIFKFTGMQLALLLAAESVVLLVMGRLRASPVLTVGAAVVAPLAVGWGLSSLLPKPEAGLYTGLALCGFMFANAMWSARAEEPERPLQARPQVSYYSLLALAVLLAVTWLYSSRPNFPVLLGAESLLLMAFLLLFRAAEPAVLGQGFLLLAHLAALALYDGDSTSAWRPAFLVALTVAFGAYWRLLGRGLDRADAGWQSARLASLAYGWLAALASLYWIHAYVPMPHTILAYSLVGLALFLAAGARQEGEWLPFSGLFTAAALAFAGFELLQLHPVRWMEWLAVLLLLAQQRLARVQPDRYPVPPEAHACAVTIGGLFLWWLLSRWVMESSSGFYLTASWSVFALALFTAGILARERLYRWLGLGILACAVGRVVVFDVWKLDTGFRVLSFLALGIVLMVLGFIYNRYQEKIRQWL